MRFIFYNKIAVLNEKATSSILRRLEFAMVFRYSEISQSKLSFTKGCVDKASEFDNATLVSLDEIINISNSKRN